MKFVILFLVILNILAIQSLHYETSFLKIENCTSSNEKTVSFKFCEASKEEGLTVKGIVKRPLNKINVNFVIFFRGNLLKTFISQFQAKLFKKTDRKELELFYTSPNFEWCSFISMKTKLTIQYRIIVTLLKTLAPQLARGCPMLGRYEVSNLKIPRQFFNFGEPSKHRVDVKFTDPVTKDFAFGSVWMETIEG